MPLRVPLALVTVSMIDPITANMGGPVTFEAPELPEETLMEVRSMDSENVCMSDNGYWDFKTTFELSYKI